MIGDLVGVIFVRIADLANATFEVDPRALLDDVGGFVRGRMQVGG